MSKTARISNERSWSIASLAAVILLALCHGTAIADGELEVVKIEEDWELIIATPDPDSVAPQVTCAISPTGGCEGVHATFELNSQSLASYSAGGLQLQVWNGEAATAASREPEYHVLAVANETITWTTEMTVSNGDLAFAIRNGNSQTWGPFGGQGYLCYTMETSLTNLNGYQISTSVENSGVGYAGNRVRSLVLKRLRVTTSSGEVIEETTDKIVHELDQ